VRWIAIVITGVASAGLIAVSVAMNFAFGSSFGRTALESHAYGAAFAFADILKVAAPIVVAKSLANRKWGAASVAVLVWGTFTVCSAVSAIGFASANRTFAMDARTVQAALNQSRLKSLEADQYELRRLRDRLASPDLSRSERLQLGASVQRLEAGIGAARGKLEDAAPVVSTSNPQAHTLAGLTGADINNVETLLILLVALLVEMGGLGPFVTMNLAKVLRKTKVPAATQSIAQPTQTPLSEPLPIEPPATSSPTPAHRPNLFFAATENLQSDIGRFLNLHAQRKEGSTLGSSELLGRYNSSRRKSGRSQVSQRRFGDTMNALGYRKLRLGGGRVHYLGLTWVAVGVHAAREVARSSYRPVPNKPGGASQHRNGAHAKRLGVRVRPPHDYMNNEGPRP
jgi:hypothetical protein